jgi:membrane fusion protein
MTASSGTDAATDAVANAPEDRPPLFRPEVADRHWEILQSNGLLPQPPRHATLVIAVLAVIFTAVGILVARGAFPRVEFARGYLEPTAGVVRLRAPRQSIIGAVHVKDGQRVAGGDTLVTLQSGQTMESGIGAEAEIAAQLHSQRTDIEAQIGREGEWTRNEERRLATAADELDHDIRLLAVTMQTQQKQLALTQEHADRIRDLAEKGTVSRDELQRRDLAVLSQRLAVQNADRELAGKRAALVAARIAIEQLPTVANERLRALREGLANVQQRLVELETRRALVVRAPLSGRIAAIPVFVGADVSGSLIATIVPDESELHARLFVPTRAIGKVRAGQSVSIRYDAFPYQKYGSFKGRIEDVSNSVILPQEAERISPVKLAEPAYVLDVAIQRQSVRVGGESRRSGVSGGCRSPTCSAAPARWCRRPFRSSRSRCSWRCCCWSRRGTCRSQSTTSFRVATAAYS